MITAPMPGSASSSACTTARICGTTDSSRKVRITRSPRSADKPPPVGISPITTTIRSNTFQALLKNSSR